MIAEPAQPWHKTKILERGIFATVAHRRRALPIDQTAGHGPEVHLGIRKSKIRQHTLEQNNKYVRDDKVVQTKPKRIAKEALADSRTIPRLCIFAHE